MEEEVINDPVFVSQKIAKVTANKNGVRAPRQRKRVQSVNIEASMTKQADKDRACIHKILEKGSSTGLYPVRDVDPLQGDLPDVDSFHDAMTTLVQAQEAFEALPVELRQRFDNSPKAFLEFVGSQDDDGSLSNYDELVSLGFIEPPVEPEVFDVNVVNADASAGSEAAGGESTPAE